MQQDGEYWLVSVIGALISWLVGWLQLDSIIEAIQVAFVWAIIGVIVKRTDKYISNKLKKNQQKEHEKSK